MRSIDGILLMLTAAVSGCGVSGSEVIAGATPADSVACTPAAGRCALRPDADMLMSGKVSWADDLDAGLARARREKKPIYFASAVREHGQLEQHEL